MSAQWRPRRGATPIDDALVGAGDRTQPRRQGEGEQIVITGEQARAHAVEPLLAAILLARGAVAVAAGVIAILESEPPSAGVRQATRSWSARRWDGKRLPACVVAYAG